MAVSTIDPNGLNIGQIGGTRNKIINGAMTIDQRNAGASVAFPVGTSIGFPVDRWRCQNAGGTSAYSAQRVAEGPAGFQNSLKITTTTAAAVTAADSKHMWLPIEGFDVADLGFGTSDAKTVTLSFWVRSSVTGNHGAALSSDGAARAYAFLYNIAQANTWEYKTVTIPGDTTGTWLKDSGTGMRVNFNFGSGADYIVTPNMWGAGPDRGAIGQVSVLATSGATWQITGVQLEAGDTATPFEHRSYGQELQLCQRFFQLHGTVNFQGWNHNIADTGGTRSQAYSFPVTMRATPSITYQDNSGNSQRIYAEYPNSTSGNNITFNFYANSSCIMGFKYPYGNLYGSNGDSYMISAYALKLDAEL